MHASASLSEDTCCWVYFTECKVHQLPSRLPKIFHCKLLSSREHGYKYKYTKVMLLDFPPPPPRPEAKGTWVAIFLGQHTKMGLLGDAENYQRRRKQVHELLLVLVWKLLSVPPHPLARASCRGHHVHLCPNAWVYLQQSWCFPHPKWEKCLPREFFGGKTSPGLRFFFPSPSIS